tara:strand:- start:650 stop:1390 length:741 start_codon:yes stop_codon:yes gene_type:complete
MAKKRMTPRPIISNSLSNAAGQVVVDALDAGFDIDEITLNPDKKATRQVRGEAKFSQEGLDEIASVSNNGSAIPGQSLSNDPEQPYPWEKPATFSNPREALDTIVEELLQPEAMKNIVGALVKGAAVADLSLAVLYAKFTQGDINPDTLLLLVEPVMYIMMAVGEEANIKYNIEGNDLDEFDEEDNEEEESRKLDEFKNSFTNIKKDTVAKELAPSKIKSGAVPTSLLEKVTEQGPEIRSMLSRGQ